MTRRLWFQAAAILTLGLSAQQALTQQAGTTVTYLGTQESIQANEAKPRLYQVLPAAPVISFPAFAVGAIPGAAQQITAVFNVNGNPGTFTPTAVLHYGTSYSAGAVTCTGPVASMTCNVTITFQPALPGGRKDALFFMNGTTRLASVLLYGVGQSPLALVQPGVVTMPIKNSPNYLYTSTVDEAGTVYQLETGANAIESITKAGVVTTLPITGLNSPRGIGIDGAGVLYIADQTATGPTITYDTVRGIQGSIPFPPGAFYIQTLTVGNTGNIYETDDLTIWTITPSGTVTSTPISPSVTQGATMTVDGNEDVFLGGYTINEIPFGGTQLQVNANGAGDGLGVDAAGTLYASRYDFNSSGSVAELPAASYSTPLVEIDPSASPLGSSVGPDGTVYVGNYVNLDKVDRSQGLVAFGNSTTGSQTVAIYNGGNQALTISNIAISGSSAFTLAAASTNNCTGDITIAPGALCNVSVIYSTTHAGFFNGTLTFTDNSVNNAASTQTVAITAESQGIYVTPSPASLNFGTQQVGTTSGTMPVTFTNNGDGYSANITVPTGTGPFTVTAGTCVTPTIPLQVGQSCTMLVTFDPTTATTYTNTSISFGATWFGPAQVVTFTASGTGIAPTAPVGSFAPASLAFGTQNINTTSPSQPLLLTNTGNAQLNINSISITGTNLSNFAQTNTCGGGIAPNGSCTINVTFSPNVTGPFLASVSVATNAAVSPTTAALTGTGVSLQVPQLQFNTAQLSAIAGTGAGRAVDTGDGGQALLATFDAPFGIAQDAAGNIYVADQDDNYVRKIDTTGKITAFAGLPNVGPGSFSGDNGQATAANLSQPIGIAIDAAGSIYIADYGNSRIRKVVPSTGVITTYAGIGNGFFSAGPSNTVPLPGPQGIAFDAAGNLYVACTNQQIIAKITPGTTPMTSLFAGVLTPSGPGVNSYNGDNQLAYLADLNFPTDVAADQAGNIYIADSVNARIRKVAASTGIITTVAGTGTAGNTGDGAAATSAQVNVTSVATNLAGEIYINTNSSIRKVDVNGNISTIAGGGTGTLPAPATSVLLGGLGLVRTDRYGDLLIPSFQHFDGVLEAGPQGLLVFPSQPVGTVSAPLTVTFENTGDSTLTLSQTTYTASSSFNVTGGTCLSTVTLAPAGTCTLTATFAPTVAGGGTGAYGGSIPVASNSAGGATSVLLQGNATTAISAPVGVISPNPDVFLPSPIGQGESAPQPMSFTNTGTGPMTITGISITGANASSFEETNLCPVAPATLAAGSSCGITLVFTPTTGGVNTANISVASNSTNSPTLGVLTGTGTTAQAVLTPNPLVFGTQAPSTNSAPMTVTLSNPGSAPLVLTSTTLGGAEPLEFGETNNCPLSIAAGGSCTFTFIFSPTAAGSRTATLTFVDGVGTQVLQLSGTGTATTAPQAALNPNPLAFPSTAVGASSQTMTMSLGNNGNAALAITSISITGTNASSFSQTNNCGTSLPLDSSCLITITFKPTAAGALSATVTVVDNASGSPQTATITGTGTAATAPQATLNPNPLTFPSTTVGSSAATMTMSLGNPGSAALTGIAVSITGSNASSFSQTNNCGTSLPLDSSCQITVTFTPTTSGVLSASISVSDNATGSPQTATITGTGAAVVTTGTYTVNSSTPSASVQPGAVAQYNLTIAPLGGSYNNLVTLSASGLPAGATASFLPPAVTPGSAGAPSVLSIQTAALQARLTNPDPHRPSPVPLLAVLTGVPLLGLAARRRFRKTSRRWMLLAIAALAILPALAISGCSGGYYGAAAKTFTITVTGTSGSLQETTTVSLTVQ
jgi:trimeric autotransporter adhesin